ncbi:MAG: PhzF family phenazine biosynthesis protein [Candidatus Delongbacteria bacterium]
MRAFPFRKVDAFATSTSAGNPAGVVRLAAIDELSASDMLRLAAELQGYVNEVAFLAPQGERLALRFFSAEREVEFCGHATIAALHDLLATNAGWRARPVVEIVTRKGVLAVENQVAAEDAVYITAPAPRVAASAPPAGLLAEALGLPTAALDSTRPPAVVNAGLETLLVPLAGLEALLALAPDYAVLRAFCQEQGLDIVLVHCRETVDPSHAFRTRVFAPTFGYLEDPATGSGSAALGHHLLLSGEWDGAPLVLEQNGRRNHANRVRLKARRADDGWDLSFGGGAVTRLRGEYLLA